MSKVKFGYVKCDYREHSTGEIAIDAYPTKRMDDDSGRVVAWVSPDGEVKKGNSPLCEPNDLDCPNVQAAIERAKEKQSDIKQKLVDEALEEIKKDIANGDLTAIEELLMQHKFKAVLSYLPEEKWNEFK